MSAPFVAIVSFVFASAAFAMCLSLKLRRRQVRRARGGQADARRRPRPAQGPSIVVETEKGTFEFETYPNEAPKTVAHILGLVNKRFYNGQRVHRVVPGFVDPDGRPADARHDQGGDVGPRRSGTPIGVAEFSKLRTHVRGAVAMAHDGDACEGRHAVVRHARPTRRGSTATTWCSAR